MPFLPPRFKDVDKMSPLQNYMSDILTVAPNLAGIPMLSMPCGFIKGLPVGMHLMSDHLREEKILRLARAYELETKITEKKPKCR